MGIEHHTGLHTVGTDVLQTAVQVCAGLVVYGDILGGCIAQNIDIPVRVHYHQVYVQRFLCSFGYIADNRKSEGYVGNEYSVHHIQVDVVALGGVEHVNGLAQTGEVRGEYRRGYLEVAFLSHGAFYLHSLITSSSSRTNLSRLARSSLSPGACTPRRVGPNEIMSRWGYLSRKSPHSSPA